MDWQTISPSQACKNLPISAAVSTAGEAIEGQDWETDLRRCPGDRWTVGSRCGRLFLGGGEYQRQSSMLSLSLASVPKPPPPPRLLKPPPLPPLSPPRPRNDPLLLIVGIVVSAGCGWVGGRVELAGVFSVGCGRCRGPKRKVCTAGRAPECAAREQTADRADSAMRLHQVLVAEKAPHSCI